MPWLDGLRSTNPIKNGEPARRQRRDALEQVEVAIDERRVRQQVARGISGRRHLREHDEVSRVRLGACHGGADPLEVGVERTDREVELGESQAHGAMISDTKILTSSALLAFALATTRLPVRPPTCCSGLCRPRTSSTVL